MNNALNGVAMNLEVVRLRARPGGDAGAAAPFAAAAIAEHEALAALVGAAVALGRTPRGERASVQEVTRGVTALLGPTLRHRGVTLDVDLGDAAALTTAPADAVTVAVSTTLEAAAAALAGAPGAAPVGGASAEPARALRCSVTADPSPAVTVAPWGGAWPAGVVDALEAVGVRLAEDPADGSSPAARLRLLFPTA